MRRSSLLPRLQTFAVGEDRRAHVIPFALGEPGGAAIVVSSSGGPSEGPLPTMTRRILCSHKGERIGDVTLADLRHFCGSADWRPLALHAPSPCAVRGAWINRGLIARCLDVIPPSPPTTIAVVLLIPALTAAGRETKGPPVLRLEAPEWTILAAVLLRYPQGAAPALPLLSKYRKRRAA